MSLNITDAETFPNQWPHWTCIDF